MSIIQVPANKLIVSERYQARQTPGQQPLPELADSIYAQGLLQNLVGVKAKKRGFYEVTAGGRRTQAIQILLQDGRWDAEQDVPFKLIDEDVALEASITENIHREAMHPADEFEAFAKLLHQGKTIEDIAARFGIAPREVKRRLKLAHVAPELIQAYRQEEMSLQMLMAFTVTDDQERQKAVWAQMDDWDRKNVRPSQIKAMLTDQAANAAHHLVKFVGLDAYLAAGGRIHSDLFAQEDDPQGTYLQDFDILQRLAQEKLQQDTERLGQGWAWVSGALSHGEAAWNAHSTRFGKVYAQERKLTKTEAKQVKALTAQIDALSEKMDALADNDGDDDEWLALEEEHDSLVAQRDQIQAQAEIWPDDAKRVAGVGVFVSHDGTLNVTYGLIRPEDRQAAKAASTAGAEHGEGEALRTSLPPVKTRPTHSERLVRQLTANKVGIVGVELAARPDIALSVLVAQLARQVFGSGYFSVGDYGLGIGLKTEALDHHAPDFAQSKAGVEMAKYRQHWLDQMPIDEDGDLGEDVLAWALDQDQATLLELLAYCLGTSVQGVRHTESTRPTELDALASTIGIDVSQWWEPTAESYLNHVSKDQVVAAVTDKLGAEQAAPLLKLKKIQTVEQAQQLLQGKGWLPQPLQIATRSQA